MWKILKSSFKADIKFIARDPVLVLAVLSPFLLILFLRLVFPPISSLVFSKAGFQLDNYYTLSAITMVSVIPLLYGFVYAFILPDRNDLQILQLIGVSPAGYKKFLYMRMIVQAFLSFFIVLFTVFLTNPVPSEGWLRTIFISFLLSTQTPFIFLFIVSFSGDKVIGIDLSKLSCIFLVAVPLGLLLHHPWNYFTFFSPLYWISWAWVISVPAESIIYCVISVIITFVCILIFFRHQNRG